MDNSSSDGGNRVEIKAIVFDLNGTLIDINTDEHCEDAFRAVSRFLTYHGICIRRGQLHDTYFDYLHQQRKASPHHHPEFDAVGIWQRIIDENSTAFTHASPYEARNLLALSVAQLYRAVSRRRLRLYPHVKTVLDELGGRYPLAVVTDGQSAYARGELHKVGLLDYFDPVVVSGDHGFRKPDRRLFEMALARLGVNAENALYVGNDMYRDVHGASRVGMPTVMVNSEQGRRQYRDCAADFTITDLRELAGILNR